jgi:5'-nucleotidase / UDP-sugar diphosphatase
MALPLENESDDTAQHVRSLGDEPTLPFRHQTRSTVKANRRPATLAALGAVPAALIALALAALPGDGRAAADTGTGELFVTFAHTSDEHSTLLPAPFVEYRHGEPDATRGGFARLATAVEALRARKTAAGEPVLLTSAGDNLSGSAFSWLILTGEAPELRLMVELGYDVVTLGNHEFDYGSERLASYLETAGYPAVAERTAVVASNTRPPAGHPLGERGIRNAHLETLPNGLRVGFLGLLGKGAARYANLAAPVEFADAHEAAAAAVAELRQAGAEIVVAITHSGLEEDRALARAVSGIDVILGGHDHRLLEEPVTEAGTLIVHPGAHLQQLFTLELAYDRATGGLRVRNPETGAPYVVPLDSTVVESPWMAARVADYRRKLESQIAALSGGRVTDIAKTVVRSDFTLFAGPALSETTLGNFVSDAVRAAAEATTGEPVDFAFQASGMIRGDLVPGGSDWNRNDISFFDLAKTVGMGFGPDSLPGYPLVSVWLTGEEVRRVVEVSVLLSGLMGNSYYLQVSGLRAQYDPGRAIWGRIPVRGTPIPSGRAVLSAERVAGDRALPLQRGDTALYHIVTDRYVASFLPMVGEVVPSLTIVAKDRHGAPLDDLDTRILRRDGQEVKVWQAVLEHAAAQPPGGDGHARVAALYAAPADRLVVQRGTPLWIWPATALAAVVALIAALLVLRRRRRTNAGPAVATPRSPRAEPIER